MIFPLLSHGKEWKVEIRRRKVPSGVNCTGSFGCSARTTRIAMSTETIYFSFLCNLPVATQN